jgi:hypothetical protein
MASLWCQVKCHDDAGDCVPRTRCPRPAGNVALGIRRRCSAPPPCRRRRERSHRLKPLESPGGRDPSDARFPGGKVPDSYGRNGASRARTGLSRHGRSAPARRRRRRARGPQDAPGADRTVGAGAGRCVRDGVPDGRAAAAGRRGRSRPAPRPRGARGGARRAGRAAAGGTGGDRRARRRAGREAADPRAHAVAPGRSQVRADLVPGAGRARLRRLAGAPSAGPDRHADGLVAGQALVRLSVTPGPRRRPTPDVARITTRSECGRC